LTAQDASSQSADPAGRSGDASSAEQMALLRKNIRSIKKQVISANDFTARNPSHFLEDRDDKKNLIGIVRDDNTIVQCLENGLHLLERLRPFAFHEISLFLDPKQVQLLLINSTRL
jgi:hypothetical protein